MKFVSGLEFTSIDPGLIVVSSGVAISPTEKKIRTQWENNSSAVDLGFNAHAFGRRWECKVQRLPENHRIGLADNVAFHGMKHLRFQQKSGGIGPVPGGNVYAATSIGKAVVLDLGERARPRNTRRSGIAEFISRPGIEGSGTNRRLPLPIG